MGRERECKRERERSSFFCFHFFPKTGRETVPAAFSVAVVHTIAAKWRKFQLDVFRSNMYQVLTLKLELFFY